jgi:hypothetical protein
VIEELSGSVTPELGVELAHAMLGIEQLLDQ